MCACFLEQNHIFFGDVIVSCMTAGLGIKMAASNSKWQVCDVIVTSRHVIIDPSYSQSVKLMTCYKPVKFHRIPPVSPHVYLANCNTSLPNRNGDSGERNLQRIHIPTFSGNKTEFQQ